VKRIAADYQYRQIFSSLKKLLLLHHDMDIQQFFMLYKIVKQIHMQLAL